MIGRAVSGQGVQKVVIASSRRRDCETQFSKVVQQALQKSGNPVFEHFLYNFLCNFLYNSPLHNSRGRVSHRPSAELNFGAPPIIFLRPRFFCCPSPVLNLPYRRRLADVLPQPRWPIFVPSSTTHAQKLMQTSFCEPKGNFGLRRSSKRCHCCLQTLGNHLVTSTHPHSGSEEWP